MKSYVLSTLCLSLLFSLSSFANKSAKNSNDHLPVLDLQKKTPVKELPLQEIGKVRYIQLDTPGNVLLGEHTKLSAFKNYLFFAGSQSGDVTGFNTNGQMICNFNHKGQGPGEYIIINKVIYNETAKEVYVASTVRNITTLYVYDLEGKFKRQLTHSGNIQYGDILSLDEKTLLASDNTNTLVIRKDKIEKLTPSEPAPSQQPFILLDTNTGKEISRLPLSYAQRFKPYVLARHKDLPWVFVAPYTYLAQSGNNYILNIPSADTTYLLQPGNKIKPIFTRTPSIAQMDPRITTCVTAYTPNYIFIETVLLKPADGESDQLKRELYIYNQTSKTVENCALTNTEFKDAGDIFKQYTIADNKLYVVLYPHILVQAADNNQLSGELKKITMQLDEEDNPLIMEVLLNE